MLAIIALLIFVVLVGYGWLREVVSVTVVQPVRSGELTGPFLSEKRRYKAIKEDWGWLIGLLAGLALGFLYSLL